VTVVEQRVVEIEEDGAHDAHPPII
jgi:hypothetical protein